MDKYCVEDLNHLDDSSVNLFDSKDPTIKNENFIYFKTEDLHCKIEENDVLVFKNTRGVIENLTGYESTDGVANLKNEFIAEDCVRDETVVAKIEITEHTLEFGTIQELEHIGRDYGENVADEGTDQETPKGLKLNKLPKQVGNSHINQAHLRKIKTKKCDQCDWEGYSAHFSAHVRTKHLGEEFNCDKCNYKAKTKRNLVTHQLVHSKAKRFSCPKCTYQTNYNSTLKVHLKYHEDNVQSCPECSQWVQEANFYQHVRNHRRKKLKVKKKCPECGKEVFELSKHLLIHKGDRVRIQCPECSFSAVNRRILKRHIQKYHEEQESFICYHCNREIVSKSGLIYHLRAVHTDDSCECHICGKKLMSKLYLSAHVRRLHDNVKWFECDLCPEETRFRSKHVHNLKRHRILHLIKDEARGKI